jgi:hypothetical membrane protein
MSTNRPAGHLLLLAAPIFVVGNAVTALGWDQPPFSLRVHNISDLGNVNCGIWDTSRPRPVCSPWHPLMNVTFVVTGLLIVAGLLLAWSALGRGAAVRAAQVSAIVGATGYVLAGVYPADVDENLHVLGALFVFVAGNVTMLAAASTSRSSSLGPMRWFALAMGLTGLAATALFLAQVDLGFGVGGMERVAVAPFLLWTIVLGARLGAPRRPYPALGPASPVGRDDRRRG